MVPKKNSVLPISIIAIVTLAVSLLLFNIKKCSSSDNIFSASTLGQFGDFYGGILGTLITFFGLYFIYRTYKLQNDQLDIAKDQLDIAKKDADLEIVNKLYSELLDEINSIQYRRKIKNENGEFIEEKEKLFVGIDALYNFDKNHSYSPNSVLNHLNSIIVSFDQLIYMVENRFKYKHKETKDILLTKIYFLFYSKIIWPAYQQIYRYRKDELITSGHGDAPALFDNYKRLTKKAYNYLLTVKRVGRPHKSDVDMIKIIDE